MAIREMMKALLIRVGIDQSKGGGLWNAPMDLRSRKFVYVPIVESYPIRPRFGKTYNLCAEPLKALGSSLPPHLASAHMHLDPDFDYLTYGDQGQRAFQIQSKLDSGDLLVFYAAFKDVRPTPRLIYALIGLFVIQTVQLARSIPLSDQHKNAHTRRILNDNAADIIVTGRPDLSGRLEESIPIGSFRSPIHAPAKRPSYRVERLTLAAWGGLSVSDGYIQRSARLPEFLNADLFYEWFLTRNIKLLARNN